MRYFLYVRKSTEDGDRQILSIQSQIDALKKIANQQGLTIARVFEESKSAKAPGREQFDEMLGLIEKGQAQAILCWKLDRLARNPVDGGKIQWLLQNKIIQKIITPDHTYLPGDNALIASVELGMANQYVRDLSTAVKRGLDTKAEKGWRPGRAPLGYLNSRTQLKGEQTILSDPERFPLMRQLFDRMLTGNSSVSKLLIIANEELGLTAKPVKKSSTRQLHLGELYQILKNPFYYGVFKWGDAWIKGGHRPIITVEEFDRIQQLLGRKGNPRPQTHQFAFTGLMRCLWCDSSITAEKKTKRQKNGNVHEYIYYRCTKKKGKCPEGAIELEEFNRLVDEILSRLTIPEDLKNWAIEYARQLQKGEDQTGLMITSRRQKEYAQLDEQIKSLTRGFFAPENSNRQIMSLDEYLALKDDLTKQKVNLATLLATEKASADKCLELTERTFNFAAYARYWFKNGDEETRRSIFAALGSNFGVISKKVFIYLNESLEMIIERLPTVQDEIGRFEPQDFLKFIESLPFFKAEVPVMSG